ncbi:MAG: UDP-2,3-diacylglucosamine diphosphatase LpxI [Planctomycetota bacterium]
MNAASSATDGSDPLPPIGLIAGGGSFPFEVARAARAKGHKVVCAGIRLEVSPELRAEVDVFRPIGLLGLARYIKFFRAHGVRSLTWAGWIHKETLLSWSGFFKHLPDYSTFSFWWRRLRQTNHQSQTVLGAIADEFEENGFHLAHSTEFCPDLLVQPGVLTKKQPSKRQLEDVAFGWRIAKKMAELDVGQSVAICDGATVAVEGMEGTDRNILRAGELVKRPITIVKLAMDDHDMRFDVPTIGPKTIDCMKTAGANMLALEARKTIVLEREETLAKASKAGIVIAAFESTEFATSGSEETDGSSD